VSGHYYRFRCPACSDLMSASLDMVGGTVVCGNCETPLEVPPPIQKNPPPQTESPQDSPKTDTKNATAREKSVHFRPVARDGEGDLDMTPMVDVTFLLLIFFMVTASFQIQKSLQVPVPKSDLPSAAAQQQENTLDDPDNITVRIDSGNTYFVTCAAWDQEREAPSVTEMYKQVRLARVSDSSQPPSTLMVIVHVLAKHERVVSAIDAGAEVGVNSIRLMSTEEDI